MFGVILLPDFALQAALRHQPSCSRREPVAILSGGAAAKPVIVQCNASSLVAGVQVGMTSSQALGRCGHLRLLSRSSMQEAASAAVLLENAFSCSPWVEVTAEGICTFEIRNSLPVTEDLAGRVLEHLAQLDLQARVGFAANPDLALLAAHAARLVLVVRDSRAFLANLPITALNPNPRPSAILQKWGIATVGAFGSLPDQEVTRRLGGEGHSLWLRATGRQHRLLRLASLPESCEENAEFEYEVQTLEPLLFVLRRFLDQLVLRLEAIYRVPAALDLQLRFDDGQAYSRHFAIPSPTNNVESLFRVLHTWKISRLRLPFGVSGLRSLPPLRRASNSVSLRQCCVIRQVSVKPWPACTPSSATTAPGLPAWKAITAPMLSMWKSLIFFTWPTAPSQKEKSRRTCQPLGCRCVGYDRRWSSK